MDETTGLLLSAKYEDRINVKLGKIPILRITDGLLKEENV